MVMHVLEPEIDSNSGQVGLLEGFFGEPAEERWLADWTVANEDDFEEVVVLFDHEVRMVIIYQAQLNILPVQVIIESSSCQYLKDNGLGFKGAVAVNIKEKELLSAFINKEYSIRIAVTTVIDQARDMPPERW